MNSRIIELAEQAGAVKYEVDYRRDAYPTNLEELKKFAELIVKECANFITETATIETLLGDRLKEHFGVEE